MSERRFSGTYRCSYGVKMSVTTNSVLADPQATVCFQRYCFFFSKTVDKRQHVVKEMDH